MWGWLCDLPNALRVLLFFFFSGLASWSLLVLKSFPPELASE